MRRKHAKKCTRAFVIDADERDILSEALFHWAGVNDDSPLGELAQKMISDLDGMDFG